MLVTHMLGYVLLLRDSAFFFYGSQTERLDKFLIALCWQVLSFLQEANKKEVFVPYSEFYSYAVSDSISHQVMVSLNLKPCIKRFQVLFHCIRMFGLCCEVSTCSKAEIWRSICLLQEQYMKWLQAQTEKNRPIVSYCQVCVLDFQSWKSSEGIYCWTLWL